MCFKSEEDRDQVVAILLTHAEIQDQESHRVAQEIADLRNVGSKSKKATRRLERRQEQHDLLVGDSENLKRLGAEVNQMEFHGA